MSGCAKDPTFAKGRNLITYAVDLMESNSPDSFISGTRILDTVISRLKRSSYSEWGENLEQHTLIKHMIGSASPSPVLQKLLQALGSRSPCNRGSRGRAARIVVYIAGDIHLEQFPRGIQQISSLIGTFEEYRLLEPFQRDWLVEGKEHKWHPHAVRLSDSEDSYNGDLWEGYKDLFLQGMRILRKLAADEENARIVSDTHGLLSKIMAPVTSDLLHHIDHDGWSSVVKGSLKVMSQLVSAPGEAGAKMRRDISGNSESMSTMNRILHCNKCYHKIRELSMRILTRLYMDTQVSQVTEDFIKLLLREFNDTDRDTTMRVAGEALAMLPFRGRGNDMIVLQLPDDVAVTLRNILVDFKSKWSDDNIDLYKMLAAQILEHLCIYYTKDDECLHKLEEAMIDVLPKLLGEILPEEATQTGTGAGFSSSQTDIEGQHGSAPQANDLKKSASASKIKNIKLREALLSLCVTVCETFIGADQDKARQFSAFHESSIPRKLRAMIEGTSKPTVDNLRMLKLISRMVISMVKHEGGSSYRKQDIESLLEALSIALKNMVRVDGSISMYSANGDDDSDGATTTKPFRSLASLVGEKRRKLFPNTTRQKNWKLWFYLPLSTENTDEVKA